MRREFPLHLHISTLFILLITALGVTLSGFSYYQNRQLLESTAHQWVAKIGQQTHTTLKSMVDPAEMAVNLLRYHPLGINIGREDRLATLPLLRQILLNSEGVIASVYVGYENGDFFYLRPLQSDSDRQILNAPPESRYLLQQIEQSANGQRHGHYRYYSATLELLRDESRPNYPEQYDPRQRPWYREAMRHENPITTPPYRFFTSHQIGYTIATHHSERKSVVAVDILLTTLNNAFTQQKVTPNTQLLLITGDGTIVASESMSHFLEQLDEPNRSKLPTLNSSSLPILKQIAPRLADLNLAHGYRDRLEVDTAAWQVTINPFPIQGNNPIYFLSAIPESELFADALTIIHHSLLIALAIILLMIPLVWMLSHHIVASIRRLVRYADAIRSFNFTATLQKRSMVVEVNELAITLERLKSTLSHFLKISYALVAEKDFDQLLPSIVEQMITISHSRLGILYLRKGEDLVPFTLLDHDGIALSIKLPSYFSHNLQTLLGRAMADGAADSAELQPKEIALLGLTPLLAEQGDCSHLIAIPLLNRQSDRIGAILLLRDQCTDDALLGFVEAFSGLAALSLENQELAQQQQRLFESFIQLIAGAIDAKSRYTGNHCARVPELTKQLAEAACRETSGPFAHFNLTKAQWQELHVASWLHDCGKVTTPEFVVDKATKLETIYNRIHEIRLRFEILKRDAEITALHSILNGEAAESAWATCRTLQQQLDEEFAFVAECNIGSEFMQQSNLDRLQQIAQRTWMRTLNDRLGLSYMELNRYHGIEPAPLPAVEKLLDDRPEQRITRPEEEQIRPDNPWGFKLECPPLLYNRGELYNLSIRRGTLTAEERYKINEHIIQTQLMLAQLEFPHHLKQVAEIAGNHHETMDGRGYPRRLTRQQMTPLARMVAIADIFEALTADDRPYKKGKTLSEALKILATMQQQNHIDGELFALFLRHEIYRDYATRHLHPDQNDLESIDIAALLAAIKPTPIDN